MTGEIETSTDQYRYVVTGLPGSDDTRHEAIGRRAKHGGDAAKVVPVLDRCLTRLHRYPEHIGDKYWNDRQRVPTTNGVTSIEHVDVVRRRNGKVTDRIEQYWEVECPVCIQTYRSDTDAEEERPDVIDEALACCDSEWVPPSDWVEDCSICGGDHRGEYGCRPPAAREPFPGVDERFACARCDWDGHGESLQGPEGECPDCNSAAVAVVSSQ